MENEIVTAVQAELDKIYTALEAELVKINAPGIDVNALKSVVVFYYSENVPLGTIASIKSLPQRQILITPFDKQSTTTIAQAISKRYPNLTPNIDSHVIRINLPIVSKEARESCIKDLKALCEKQKVAVRNLRRSYISQIKNNKEFSENVIEMHRDAIDKSINEFVKKIDKFFADNSVLIMKI